MNNRLPALIAIACALIVNMNVQALGQTSGLKRPLPDATGLNETGRTPPQAPKSLVDMLDVALRTNPEVLQTEAKVRQAQADLNQVRLKVTQEVITAYHERQKNRELLDNYEQMAETYMKRYKTGAAPRDEVDKALAELAGARASLAQSEAQLRYILGTPYVARTRGNPLAANAAAGASPTSRAAVELTGEARQMLDLRIELELSEEQTFGDVIDQLRELTGENFIADEPDELNIVFGTRVRLSNTSLRNALQAISDLFEVCFVFRDYGVLVTNPVRALSLRSASIPPHDELRLRHDLKN